MITPVRPVDPLRYEVPIVDAAGRPTPQFSRQWMQARGVDVVVGEATAALGGLETGFDEHVAATTSVHGIADTGALIVEGDARLSDARTPLPHALNDAVLHTGRLDNSQLPLDISSLSLYTQNLLVEGVFEVGMGTTVLWGDGSLGTIANLDADLLDGYHESAFARWANASGYTWAGAQLFTAVAGFQSPTVPFTVAGSDRVDNLNAHYVEGRDSAYLLALANATGNLPYVSLPTGSGTWPVAATDIITIPGKLKLGKGVHQIIADATGDQVLWFKIASEAFPRVIVRGSGNWSFGPGTSGATIGFGYASANLLAVSNAGLRVANEIEIDGALDHDGTTVGFYNKTPVAQGAAIADADGTLADITTKFNTALAYLRSRGDIAT